MKAATVQFWARMNDAMARRDFKEMTVIGDWWVNNVCPTCTNSGMDEGKFCDDCEHGKKLARQASR